LANENFTPLFGYIIVAWTIFSCFFYPIGIIPEIIRPIAFFNPIYQGVFFYPRGVDQRNNCLDSIFLCAGICNDCAHCFSQSIQSSVEKAGNNWLLKWIQTKKPWHQ